MSRLAPSARAAAAVSRTASNVCQREGPRTATARCLSRVDIPAVDREAFHALFANLPPLRRFFQQLITERLGADVPEGVGAKR